jgi:hypothetical protein
MCPVCETCWKLNLTAYFSSDAYELKKIVKQPVVNINVLQDENCQNQLAS